MKCHCTCLPGSTHPAESSEPPRDELTSTTAILPLCHHAHWEDPASLPMVLLLHLSPELKTMAAIPGFSFLSVYNHPSNELSTPLVSIHSSPFPPLLKCFRPTNGLLCIPNNPLSTITGHAMCHHEIIWFKAKLWPLHSPPPQLL